MKKSDLMSSDRKLVCKKLLETLIKVRKRQNKKRTGFVFVFLNPWCGDRHGVHGRDRRWSVTC